MGSDPTTPLVDLPLGSSKIRQFPYEPAPEISFAHVQVISLSHDVLRLNFKMLRKRSRYREHPCGFKCLVRQLRNSIKLSNLKNEILILGVGTGGGGFAYFCSLRISARTATVARKLNHELKLI